MGLKFYVGNAGTGKSFQLYQKVLQEAAAHPARTYLVLVPEQFTMQTQKEFVTMSPSSGILNIDILSFQRLAYRVLNETGANGLPVLDEIGKIFVVRRAAEEKKEELLFMSKQMSKIGYINEVKSMISEFIQYGVQDGALDKLIEANKEKQQLYGKLHDLRLIYAGFLSYLEKKFITSEELLDVLFRVADQSELLKGCTIVMDGFTGFTPIQKKMVQKLMQLCKDMWITVTYDTRIPLNGTLPAYHLFYMSGKMMKDLRDMAEQAGLKREEAVVLPYKENRRFGENEAMKALEGNLFRGNPKIYEKETRNIQIHVCRNPLQEMEYVAGQICRLVRNEKMRYRDIAVVTGDLNQYGEYAQRVFDRYQIPFFSDYKRNSLANPAIACILGLVECAAMDFSYESAVRLLKTGMLPIDADQTDRIQNYILAKGIRGKKRWEEAWTLPLNGLDEELLEQLNGWKNRLILPMLPFMKTLRSTKSTVREKTIELYKLMEHFELKQQLEQFKQYFEENAQTALAKEYAQIYELVVHMLEQLVDVIGEEKTGAQQYMRYLEAGFAELKVGIIPPGADQVTIGDIERSRLKDIKILFFVGVNDGVIPKNKDQAGILSQLEREQLKEQGMELAPGREEQYDTQRFYLYLSMTKPKEELYLTYSKADAQGGALNPSYLVRVVKSLFPAVLAEDEEETKKELCDIASLTEGYEFLLRYMKKEKPKGFYELYRWYESNEAYKSRLLRLREAMKNTGQQDSIRAALAKALYGNELSGSATRLETYAACAYAHFLRYGIKAKEREEYGFYNLDFGNVLHAVLEMYAGELKSRGLDWVLVPKKMQEELAEQCVDTAIMRYDPTLLYYSARDRYRLVRMKRIAKRTIWAMTEQLKRGSFVPSQYELQFHSMLEIQNGLMESARLNIRGRIDRVDVFEEEEKIYVKVVDYKTGKKKFQLFHLYCGTQLQLVIYMQAALLAAQRKAKGKKEAVAAGIVYYCVDDPLLEEAGSEPEKQNERMLKALCVDGIFNESDTVLHALDKTLADACVQESFVVPVKYNKDGALAKSSRTVNEEEFGVLMQYTEEKMKKMGEEILKGNISVDPLDDDDQNICGFCPYGGVCIQEQKDGKVCRRETKKLKDEEIYARMRLEIDKDNGGKEDKNGSEVDKTAAAGD